MCYVCGVQTEGCERELTLYLAQCYSYLGWSRNVETNDGHWPVLSLQRYSVLSFLYGI